MPKPTTVWMVHLRRGFAPTDVRGTLELGSDELVFTSDEDARVTTIALTAITRARRMRITPILMVDWRLADERRQTAFYFAKPPPMAPKDPAEASLKEMGGGPFAGLRRNSRRKQNRRNAGVLATHGQRLKPTVIAWVAELKERVAAARAAAGS